MITSWKKIGKPGMSQFDLARGFKEAFCGSPRQHKDCGLILKSESENRGLQNHSRV